MADLSKFQQHVKEQNLNVLVLYVDQHGKRVADFRRWPDAKVNVHSASKSIVGIAAGIAVKEGLLSVDEYVVDCFKEDLPETVSENWKKVQVKNLLSMTMGFDTKVMMGAELGRLQVTEPNWIRYALSLPLPNEPGTNFVYGGIGPYLMSALIAQRAGEDLVDYLMPRLFEPLGIERPYCLRCPRGYVYGGGFMTFSCDEYSRIGQMVLNYGEYNGKQILTPGWVDEMTTMYGVQEGPDESLLTAAEMTAARRVIRAEDDEELGDHYGYFFWIIDERKLFLARGKYGQFCVIDREHDAVITVISEETRDPHMVMRLIRRDIIPTL